MAPLNRAPISDLLKKLGWSVKNRLLIGMLAAQTSRPWSSDINPNSSKASAPGSTPRPRKRARSCSKSPWGDSVQRGSLSQVPRPELSLERGPSFWLKGSWGCRSWLNPSNTLLGCSADLGSPLCILLKPPYLPHPVISLLTMPPRASKSCYHLGRKEGWDIQASHPTKSTQRGSKYLLSKELY